MHALECNSGKTLPPYRRIRRRVDFEQTLDSKCLSNKWFAVYIRKNDSAFSRLGIIVSKRISPKAVSRNFCKRLIRDVFRCNFCADCALDVVVRAKRQLKREISPEGRVALMELLQAAQQ